MFYHLSTDKRSAFIGRDSTRISYKGPWSFDTTGVIDERGMVPIARAESGPGNESSFQVEFIGSGYSLHLLDTPNDEGAVSCTLDGGRLTPGSDCDEIKDLPLGSHVLNVNMRRNVLLRGIEYYLPSGPGEDRMIFEENGIADYTNLWMYGNDKNVTWHTKAGVSNRESEDIGVVLVPDRRNFETSVEFYGNELTFELRTDDVTKWHYELDGRAVPSKSEYVRFRDLCLGTHSLTIRYEPQEGDAIGSDQIRLPFNVSQPHPWSTPTLCADSASGNRESTDSSTPGNTSGPARNSAALIGGVVGGVVGLLLLVTVVFLGMRRAKRRAGTAASVAPTSQVFPTKYASSITKGSIAGSF